MCSALFSQEILHFLLAIYEEIFGEYRQFARI